MLSLVMQKIIIKATDDFGTTAEYLKMGNATLAEMVFYGLTHDPLHQDVKWTLEVDEVVINWHYPKDTK